MHSLAFSTAGRFISRFCISANNSAQISLIQPSYNSGVVKRWPFLYEEESSLRLLCVSDRIIVWPSPLWKLVISSISCPCVRSPCPKFIKLLPLIDIMRSVIFLVSLSIISDNRQVCYQLLIWRARVMWDQTANWRRPLKPAWIWQTESQISDKEQLLNIDPLPIWQKAR